MATTFEFVLPYDEFDPQDFATTYGGYTVDEAASLFDFHGRRYRLVLVEDLSPGQILEFEDDLANAILPLPAVTQASLAPLVARPGGWLLSDSGVLLSPGYVPP